ncbi:MAG: hypothetical protein HFF38_12830 [Lawsonibacter sp.]|nr:hypothetical protein [Lawsonibacter sp.]
MTFKELEHSDKFNDEESIYWVDVSGVPERFVNEAKRIDGSDYSGECFGVCIQHDRKTGEFAAIEDSPGHSLYYVDNLGYKHWLDYRLSGQELEKIVSKICMFIEEECGEK